MCLGNIFTDSKKHKFARHVNAIICRVAEQYSMECCNWRHYMYQIIMKCMVMAVYCNCLSMSIVVSSSGFEDAAVDFRYFINRLIFCGQLVNQYTISQSSRGLQEKFWYSWIESVLASQSQHKWSNALCLRSPKWDLQTNAFSVTQPAVLRHWRLVIFTADNILHFRMWFVAGHNEEISTLALQNDFQVVFPHICHFVVLAFCFAVWLLNYDSFPTPVPWLKRELFELGSLYVTQPAVCQST